MSCDLVMFQDEDPFCPKCYLSDLYQKDEQIAHEKSAHRITITCLNCGYAGYGILNTSLPPVLGFPKGGFLRVIKRSD